MTTTADPRLDRLYKLLPAIYRLRDVEQNYTLQALLQVIAEQVNFVEDDIGQLYENSFIETAEDWAVPYIADLIGYKPVLSGSADGKTAEGRALNRILIPRREVANTIHSRRRKGTLSALDDLARNVAGWPAIAIEFFKKLGWNQNINHLHLERARTVDVRLMEALDLIGTPFDSFARSVDVRRINSTRTVGRYNIPSVGVFAWRLKSYSVTQTAAYCAEESGPESYTFSVLGQDAPLFIHPAESTGHQTIDEELSVPAPIRRYPFAHHIEDFYGPDKSFAIWADGWAGGDAPALIPASAIVPANLSNWTCTPQTGKVAVDPMLGRFAFPSNQLPKKGVRVMYYYGFSADMGGGEYMRGTFEPISHAEGEPKHYYVGKSTNAPPGAFTKIEDALTQWTKDHPQDAVIEIVDSGVYVETIAITLAEKQTLQIRAADDKRPIIRMVDRQTDGTDALSATMSRSSRLTLDGLLVTGRPIYISGPEREPSDSGTAPICGSEVIIRHCTLVPGWATDCDCNPKRPAEPSIELYNVRAKLRIEHSITGPIRVNENEVTMDPIPISIFDSILDAADVQREALGSPGNAVAHVVLRVERTTVFGIVNVHAIELAENSIFLGCLNVARRQLGCMRFCYVPSKCRTPRRYHCQPDLVIQAAMDAYIDIGKQSSAIANERLRVTPQFASRRYGSPAYAQLARTCAIEIRHGAEDESEMGAFHDLFQPQREANLAARLEEFTPAGMDTAITFVT
jgi:hypothetical protein